MQGQKLDLRPDDAGRFVDSAERSVSENWLNRRWYRIETLSRSSKKMITTSGAVSMKYISQLSGSFRKLAQPPLVSDRSPVAIL
jgi:hypothetical protein